MSLKTWWQERKARKAAPAEEIREVKPVALVLEEDPFYVIVGKSVYHLGPVTPLCGANVASLEPVPLSEVPMNLTLCRRCAKIDV